MKKIKLFEKRTDSFCGTTHAMAPEFFNEPLQEYGYAVDFYAFGILLYEMIKGYYFFF